MTDRRALRRCGRMAVGLLLVAPLLGAEMRRGIPTFGVDVELVSLNVAITDPGGRDVADVTGEDVAVFENGVRQPLYLFTRESWPITLSVLIDSSDSMRHAMPVVQAAARRLLGTLEPGDRAQVAQFSRRLRVLQDLTSDRTALDAAVGAVEVEGDTALYSSLYIALKELAARRRDGAAERRAVVVLSDGSDTASFVSDEQVIEAARQAQVSVYAIGFRDSRPGAPPPEPLPTYFLTALARETGGRVFFPSSLDDLDGVYDRIARELRTLYGVAYVPSNTARDGGWRRISVRTLRPNLVVRHRTGYYAPSASRLAVRW